MISYKKAGKKKGKKLKWKNLYKNNSYYSCSLEEFGSKRSSSSLNKTGLVT